MNIKEYHSLKSHNTFGLSATARYFVTITSIDELQKIITDPTLKNLPTLILGDGSNILFTQNFPGLVIHIAIRGINIPHENADEVFVKVSAGERWHDTVLYSINKNYGGIENLSLIPGTVGAAPLQNIGAYGVELKNVFDNLEAVRISDGSRHYFSADDCEFAYRDSVFKRKYKNQYIITAVTLRLRKRPEFNTNYGDLKAVLSAQGVTELSLRSISDAVISIRQSKLPDPREIGNAGSFFKNPEISAAHFKTLQQDYPEIPHYPAQNNNIKIPAAWLIEQCGWKGTRRDQIGVHTRQALVLVNYGGGHGKEIQQLAQDIQASVLEKFAIALDTEVNII